MLFTNNVKKIKGAAHKNGNIDGMKKLQTEGCPQLKASVLIIILWDHSLL